MREAIALSENGEKRVLKFIENNKLTADTKKIKKWVDKIILKKNIGDVWVKISRAEECFNFLDTDFIFEEKKS
jgi:hypothetical protein